jgi:hypothetical protein
MIYIYKYTNIYAHYKVNGLRAVLLEYDARSGIFDTQGTGRGWPPVLVYEALILVYEALSLKLLVCEALSY